VVSTFQMILEMNGFEVEAYTSPTSALPYVTKMIWIHF
jgi:hypothetical protein